MFCLLSNALDLNAGQLLPMTDGAMVALAAAKFEVQELRPLELFDDLGHDLRALQISARLDARAFAREEHFGKGDFGAGVAVEFLDFDDVPCGDAVLFTAGFENCVCHIGFSGKKERETATPPSV